MQHEKIFKREDGRNVKVITWIDIDFQFYCSYEKFSLLKNKFMNTVARFVTPEEILETKMELWELIKPK